MSEENGGGRSASRAKNPKAGAVSCAKMLRTVPVKTVEALAETSRNGLPGHDAAARARCAGTQKKVFTSAADSFNIGL